MMLKKELFNIDDIIIFKDEDGTVARDCVCSIGKHREIDDNDDLIECNNHSITIYDNGDYMVWEKDGYGSTNKKIIHIYTLKNDNHFYEVYPTDDYGVTGTKKYIKEIIKHLQSGSCKMDYNKQSCRLITESLATAITDVLFEYYSILCQQETK